MEEKSRGIEIRATDLWSILKRCWWIMLIALVVVTVTVYLFLNATHQDKYTATVSIWALRNVGTEEGSGTSSTDVSIANYLVNDYKLMITNDAVVEKVINAQNLTSVTPDQMRGMISITHEANTRILKLSVTTQSAKSAKELADAWANTFCTFINDEKMNGEQMVTPVGEARMPEQPSNPISMVKILLIAFVAAVLVYGIYFLRFILDDKVNNAEDVERYLGLNVLGAIPNKHSVSRRSTKYGYYYAHTEGGEKRKTGGQA